MTVIMDERALIPKHSVPLILPRRVDVYVEPMSRNLPEDPPKIIVGPLNLTRNSTSIRDVYLSILGRKPLPHLHRYDRLRNIVV